MALTTLPCATALACDYLKRRGLLQGSAFSGSHDEKNFHGGISLPQNFQRAFYMQIEKVE
jgi:hypothetical protein